MESAYTYEILPTGGLSTAPNPGGGTYPAADAWTGIPILSFSSGTKIVYVWCHDNRIVVRFSFDGETWGDNFVLYDAPQAEPFYLSVQAVQVINYVNNSYAQYQVMGQW